MGTFVTIEIVSQSGPDPDASLDRAFDWFRHVEACCTRFDATSELRRLSMRIGEPVPASPTLFQAVSFALDVAEASGGAFDPTIGLALEQAGFNRHYLTGAVSASGVADGDAVSFADVAVDAETQTITLRRPLVLDLGAVAKGLAIDLAARELRPHGNFAIDAGGDVYLGGVNADGEPWSIGIRHPRRDEAVMETMRVSDCAVCTSGDYERRRRGDVGHHIIDPGTRQSPEAIASVTVIGTTAMLADALATAAFVIADRGVTPGAIGDACLKAIAWVESHGARALIVTSSLERFASDQWVGSHV
jgi:thiamine biosynthesis lipoprotein